MRFLHVSDAALKRILIAIFIVSTVSFILEVTFVGFNAENETWEDYYVGVVDLTDFGKDIIPKLRKRLKDDPTIVEGWIDPGITTTFTTRSTTHRRYLASPRGFLDDVVDAASVAGDVAGDVVDKAGDAAGAASDAVEEVADKAMDEIGELAQQVADFARQAFEDVMNELDRILDGVISGMGDMLGLPGRVELFVRSVCWVPWGQREGRRCLGVGSTLGLPALLDKDLSIAAYSVPITDFLGTDIATKFEEADTRLSLLFGAFAAVYIAAATLSSLSIILSAGLLYCLARNDFCTGFGAGFSSRAVQGRRWFALGAVLSGLATLVLLAAVGLATAFVGLGAAMFEEEGKLNEVLGIEFERGEGWLGFSWGVVAIQVLETGAWMWVLGGKCGERRRRKGKGKERAVEGMEMQTLGPRSFTLNSAVGSGVLREVLGDRVE